MLGLLLLGGLLVTHGVMIRRGKALALAPAPVIERFSMVVLFSALVGAQLAGALALHGAGALGRPSLLLSPEGSLSSAAGGASAALAGGLYLWLMKTASIRPWTDLLAYSFPFGWVVARAGCALSHDHPGRLSGSWIAVSYPGGSRLDCGLLEWLFTPLLIALVVFLGRRPRPSGLIAGVAGLSYAILRFGLDFFRATDLPASDCRWAGLTVAQWLCLPLLAVCAYLLATAARPSPRAPSL